MGFDFVVDFVELGGVLNGDRVVAFGTGTDVLHVGLRAGPPDAVDFLARVGGGLGFTNRAVGVITPADHSST